MRKWATVLLSVFVVLLVVALALPHLVDVNRYHDRIQGEVQKRVGRQVSLGPMHLSLVPLAFRVQGATVADSPRAGSDKPFARTDDLYVRVEVRPLLRGHVELHALTLQRPQIELVRNADGT